MGIALVGRSIDKHAEPFEVRSPARSQLGSREALVPSPGETVISRWQAGEYYNGK
jgi:hypothetical protein